MNPSYLSHEFKLACETDSHVLLTGESGTGKTLLAKEIHLHSGRRDQPFVVLNLAVLHSGTFEAELFGYEAGAFTGAVSSKMGRLRGANQGSIFLDEIGELSLQQQARLLEFLQSKEISPLGSSKRIALDVRVIAATNKDLEQAVQCGEFREDLFYRLRIHSVEVPPLRERTEEFGEIVSNVLTEICKNRGCSVFRLSSRMADLLELNEWPGNIRELKNILDYAVTSCRVDKKQVLEEKHLPKWFYKPLAKNSNIQDYRNAMANFEKSFLIKQYQKHGENLSTTAKKCGMNKTTLFRRLRNSGITKAAALL